MVYLEVNTPKESEHYIRIGYYDGKMPLQAKQACRVSSQKVDWLVLSDLGFDVGLVGEKCSSLGSAHLIHSLE